LEGIDAVEAPEMLCAPLEKTVLHVRALMSKLGTVSELLASAIEPPSEMRVKAAMRHLMLMGALEGEEEDAPITTLGRIDT